MKQTVTRENGNRYANVNQSSTGNTQADQNPAALAQRMQRDIFSSTVAQKKPFVDSSGAQTKLLQQKAMIGTVQRIEDKGESLQGKFAAQLIPEDEELQLQRKFNSKPVYRRVDPTTTVAGLPVNDNPVLEMEADEMGKKALQMVTSFEVTQKEEGEKKANNTGLPDNLKSGIENLSGMSMDAVKVHYNSAKPAQLNALAYTQGTDIHVGPGQEKHLPHEAWHVVQQSS